MLSVAFLIAAAASLVLAAPPAPWGLVLDGNTTVSGISAGGFMAVQFAVAFSASISGAGIFAGGPYWCAQDNLVTALSECTDLPLLLNPPTLISQAQSYASNGQIDGLGNVTRQSWYLYSGQADQTVATAVVKSIETVMQALGTPAANFAHEYSINAGHGVPTLTYGVSCPASQSPYINNCNYDGAGAIFKQLYGAGLKARGSQNTANWRTLNTYDFVPSGWLDITLSLGDTMHIYVPTACANKAKCRLHIVFHGCAQAEEFLGNVFYQNTGYAEWAETNNFVLLFPQAQSNPLLDNPLGCFDWWGYTNSDYANRNGPQMRTFLNVARWLGAKVF